MAIIDTDPYQFHRKAIEGEHTHCDTCDIVIKSKDWKSHAGGKKHRLAQQKITNELKANGKLPTHDGTAEVSTVEHKVKTGNPNMTCHKCGESGHIAKECFADMECRRCKKMGHMAKDCPNATAFACHNCGSADHKARDCTEPRVPRCRNCDEKGHMSKECPAPKDWSRVKCDNCQEMGHGRSRCPNPPVEPAADGGWGDSNTDAPTTSGDWATDADGPPADGGDDNNAGTVGDWANNESANETGGANDWATGGADW